MNRYDIDKVTEYNSLIAEFMDLKEHKGSYFHPLFEEWDNWCPNVELIYHTSWDWLMPVVKKIGGMICLDYHMNRLIKTVIECVIGGNLHLTYQAVLNFIKEHNSWTPNIIEQFRNH